MTIDIDVQYAVSKENCPSSAQIKKWAEAALEKQSNAKIAIRIVEDAEMIALNHRYRNKNKTTNILSFPCQLPVNIRGNQLGDLVICKSVIENEALEQQKSITAHWAHIIVHGILHLLGYDHENEEDAFKMESLEVAILEDLGFADPYGVKNTHE